MNKEFIRNVKLGIFVIAGMIFLVTALYFIGNNRNMFGDTVRLYVIFQDAKGLQEGNNVRYSGIDVGTVESIQLLNESTICVELSIEKESVGNIRKNAFVSIGTDGLMGNQLVNMEPGNAGGSPIEEGDTLRGMPAVDTREMLRTLEITNRNVMGITENLKELTDSIQQAQGMLYTLLLDTAPAVNFRSLLKNMDRVSANLNSMTRDFSELAGGMNRRNSLVGYLAKDTVLASDVQQTVSRVNEAVVAIEASAQTLKRMLDRINNSKGTFNMLIDDSLAAGHISNSLMQIDSSTQKLDENMEALKHHFLFRGYYKKQEKEKKKNTVQTK